MQSFTFMREFVRVERLCSRLKTVAPSRAGRAFPGLGAASRHDFQPGPESRKGVRTGASEKRRTPGLTVTKARTRVPVFPLTLPQEHHSKQ
jgi:hypothetical protein